MGIRHKRWFKWSLMLAVLFCLVLPSLRGINLASDDPAEDRDEGLHYIVRHWYANGKHKDEEGYLDEKNKAKRIPVEKREGEVFSGFATAAGHDAVERHRDETVPENSYLQISYKENIHLAKVHVFYMSTAQEKEGGETGGEETKIVLDDQGNRKKVYNTKDNGLHTDKTAEAVGQDGRDFQLTLESWFVGYNKADVGMVLDASGSMAFTSNNLDPIQVKDDRFEKMKRISQDQVDEILNPSYTDNSKLSYSNYSYFVYDDNGETKEFVPIGYWNGKVKEIRPVFSDIPERGKLIGYYPFNDSSNRYNEAEVVTKGTEREEVIKDSSKKLQVVYRESNGIVNTHGSAPAISGSGTGFNNKYRALDLVKSYTGRRDATALDIHPAGKSFTISFAVKGTDPKPVIWIGNKDQSTPDNQAWYAIYADAKKGKTKVSSGVGITTSGNDRDTAAEGVKKVEADFKATDDWAVCTYVFKTEDGKTKVSVYINGEEIKDEDAFLDSDIITEDGNTFVLLGGSAWQEDFGGDNWGDQEEGHEFLVDELYFYESALNGDDVRSLYEEMKQMMSTETLHAALAPNGRETMGILRNTALDGSGAGWYLVSSDSDWNQITNEGLLTAKRYNGVPNGDTIKNEIGNVPDGTQKPDGGNTDDSFENMGGHSPILFYVDPEGFLRCCSNGGTKGKSFCSYVYKRDDLDQRIKTEALQRALGSFVSKLGEVSPQSRVSAVRFSTDKIKDLRSLVMLDWSSNSMESTGMLGLRRGERTAVGSEKSEEKEGETGIDQYNYVLTGGTATWTGLQSYIDNLDSRQKKNDTESKTSKSLIIFTDGKDTTGQEGEEKAIELADYLKKERGYTIYCVMLQTAGVSNTQAEEFLRKLATNPQYVFSARNVDQLTNAFTGKILDRVINNLPGYMVQDYIDPRFDLVDVDGTVIHLNAKGRIEVDGVEKKVGNNGDGYRVNVTKEGEGETAGTVGGTARLFYDDEQDMYYLKWMNQTIPGCSTDAERLNVWKTRIHVRAKEDFIGGNAILTNGNDSDMNMVYHPNDTNKSSGKGDMLGGYDESGRMNDYPSKGFLRTTADTALLPLEAGKDGQEIYMGQAMDPKDCMEALEAELEDNVYYEYLKRYDEYFSGWKTDELKNGNKVEVPYYYLPDLKGTNQTGEKHIGDRIGTLTYEWKECDAAGDLVLDGRYETYTTADTDSKYYKLTVSYAPLSEEERRDVNKELILDSAYRNPRTPAGTEQTGKGPAAAHHRTDIVRGELIVEARVLLDDLRYLAEKKKDDEGLNLEEQFPLTRSYNGIESPYGSIKVSFALTADELENMEPDRSGYVSLFSEPLEPLPLGIYTIQAGSEKIFTFRGISAKVITDGEGVFTEDYTAVGKESEFAAPSDVDHPNKSVRFYMGVSKEEGVAEVDLKAQLGHAVVAYAPLDRTEEPVVTPTPTPAPLPTPSSVPTPSPTVTPQVTPTPDPVLTPTPVPKKTPKPTPKPKKKKISGSTSSKPPSTNIDDKLPSGRKDLNDPNAGKGSNPGTGDPAEPGRAVLLLVVSTVIMASLILVRCRKRKS